MPSTRTLDDGTVVRDDGWGHALESTTIAEDLRELKGFIDGTDKHEQVMKQLEEVVNSEDHERLLKTWQDRNSTNQSNNQ